jgi:glycosyltransferase involved in cell wall biosynthesis
MNGPSLSVITAVYRNADTVEELWARVAKTLGDAALSFEMIFVDDACPGESGAVIADIARQDSRVRVITNPTNLGQDRALVVGLRASVGRAAVLMDADLQDPPELIPLLVEHLERTTSDAVFADRRGHYESSGRLASSLFYRRLLVWLTQLPPRACLFVVLNRRTIDTVLRQHPACPWLLPRLGISGLVFASIPFKRDPRPRGHSAYGTWKRVHKGASSLLWALALKAR